MDKPKASVNMYMKLDLDQLESDLPFQLEHNQLIDFILRLDANMADVSFTQVLIMKLRQSLEEENIPVSEQIFELQEQLRRASSLIEDSQTLIQEKMWESEETT